MSQIKKNKAWKRYVKLKTIEAYDNYKEKLRKSVRLHKAAHFEFEKGYLKIS